MSFITGWKAAFSYAANLLSVKYFAIRNSYPPRIFDHVHPMIGVYLRVPSGVTFQVPSGDKPHLWM
jgi:hypothetical protein